MHQNPFGDFGPTINGKLSARYAFVRASVSSGFRAPTPGQQNGFNMSTVFDPALNDLFKNGTIPSVSPVAALTSLSLKYVTCVVSQSHRGGEPSLVVT